MRISKSYRIPQGAIPDLSGLGKEEVYLLFSNDVNKPNFLAIGSSSSIVSHDPVQGLNELGRFIGRAEDWYFGYLGYDLKNGVEPSLNSENQDQLDFPVIHFMQPRVVAEWKGSELQVHALHSEADCDEIASLFSKDPSAAGYSAGIELLPCITRSRYLRDVMSLQGHIRQGDIYEVNYCMEFGATGSIDPWKTWLKLNAATHAPFAAYVQTDPCYLLCGSPERFLRREGDKLISQPIKGTRKRGADANDDERLKRELELDAKERSENIMITDLVRNDLSRSATKGSVIVEELCKVYSFETVHQMISTVSCTVPSDTRLEELIRHTFPMGSMTGAPKYRAMQLIESHEAMKRGLYSGSVGYVRPGGDFDFNVVIRSILYQREKAYLAAMVGSAITSRATAELEYEECLVKARALLESVR